MVYGKKEYEPGQREVKEVEPDKKEFVLSEKITALPPVEYWSRNKLIDELVYHLCSINSCIVDKFSKQIVISHKYLDRAEWIIYRINLWKPVPKFTINRSDLTNVLKQKIADSCHGPTDLDETMTRTVRRILEAVNPRYFHLSGIYGKVRWGLEP